MIDPGMFIAFLATVAALMLIPGPNVALIVSNSVAYGTRFGLITVAGTSSAMCLQLALTALGMTQVLGALGAWFEWVRWIGVVYLVWLGVSHWRAPSIDLTARPPQPRSARTIYLRGLLVSATNPKMLLFYGAFFPQFVTATRPIGSQIAVLSFSFLAVALPVDSAWALIAGRARRLLASRGRWRNRLSGGLLIGAGAALALVHRR